MSKTRDWKSFTVLADPLFDPGSNAIDLTVVRKVEYVLGY